MTARPSITGTAGAVTGESPEPFLTPAEAAEALRVDVRTLARWARQGTIASIRTPGGVRRYPQSEIARLLGDVQGPLMTTGEVAAAFGVNPKTVTRWTQAGKLASTARTAGGQRRFPAAQIHALLLDATRPGRTAPPMTGQAPGPPPVPPDRLRPALPASMRPRRAGRVVAAGDGTADGGRVWSRCLPGLVPPPAQPVPAPLIAPAGRQRGPDCEPLSGSRRAPARTIQATRAMPPARHLSQEPRSEGPR